MHNFFSRFPFSLSLICFGSFAVLAVAYIGFISVVMTYATLTVSFSQSVKNDEATVATLESQYLAAVARITSTDYSAAGYVSPVAEIFVPSEGATALR